MPTDVGELVINLAFESGDAKAEMRALVSEVGNIDKSFQALAAEAGHFGKGLDGAKNRAASLTSQLEMQNKVVEQAGKATQTANQKLQEAQKRQGEYAEKVKAASEAHDQAKASVVALKGEVKSASDALTKAAASEKTSIEEFKRLSDAVLDAQDAYEAAEESVKELSKAHDDASKQLKQTNNNVKKAANDLQHYAGQEDITKVKAGQLKQALEGVNREVKLQGGLLNAVKLKEYGDALEKTAQKQVALGKAATMAVTLPVVGGLTYAAKEAIGWESAFAGVEKTVDGTAEQLAAIRQGLIDMSEEVPTARNELAGIAEAAGQLGIQTQNVLGFTRVMTDLKEATNLGDEGASQMAKFANITGMAQTNFDRAGSTIVELGNNMATTEKDIMAMSMRLAGAGKQIGMNEASTMGFAAALSSLGIEAQAGGSSFSKLMVDMQLAVETGKNGLKDYAKIAGMTGKQFQTAFKDDAAGAIAAFVSGLGSGGQSAIKILDDIGISEVRMRDALLRASNASGLFAGSIKMANGAWKANTALANEASKRYATFESRLKMAGNQAKNAAMQFGEDLMPALEGGLQVVTDLIGGFSELNESTRGAAMSAALMAAGIGPGITLIGKGNQVIAGAAQGLATFKTAVVNAGGGVKGFVGALGGALGPMGVAALTAAVAYGVYKWYDYASGAMAAREATEGMIATAKEWRETQAQTIFDTGNDPFARFGMEKSDFGGGVDESKDWLSRLNETWTDGKKETSEIVKGYVDEFSSGSDKIRESIKERKRIQAGLGAKDPANDEYLKQLGDMDAEVEHLLKKRKNGALTEEDQTRLNEIIQRRVQIQLEYTTGEGGGYGGIKQGVEAEKARIAAEGGKVGVDLYADALKAGAQGHQTQVDALNASYREQYAAVQALDDEKKNDQGQTERDIALLALNAQHQEALNAARAEYNALVGEYAPEAFKGEEVQQAAADMQMLKEKIAEFQSGSLSATDLDEFADTLNEGKLASYIALLKQLEKSGLGDIDLGDGITANELLGGYDTVADYLKANAGTLTGLGEMLGAASDEANRVLVEMQLTPEGQALKDQLDTWAASGVEVTAVATITGYNQETGEPMQITGVNIKPETGEILGYNQATGEPVNISGVNIAPETGEITGYDQTTGAPIKISGVKLLDETGTIIGYVEATDAAKPMPQVQAKLKYGDFSGIEQSAIDNYLAANPGKKPTVTTNVGFQTGWAQTLQDAFDAGNVEVFGEGGAKIDVTPEVLKQIGPTDVWTKGFDDEGNPTLSIIMTPKLGTREAADTAIDRLEQEPESPLPAVVTESTAEKVNFISGTLDSLKELKQAGVDTDSLGAMPLFDQLMSLSPDNLKDIGGGIATILEAMKNEEMSIEEGTAALEPLLAVIRAADEYLGVGNDVSAGIAEGMNAYGWTGDAATLIGDVESALRNAAQSRSPAQKYVPLGHDVAAGVGSGMKQYSFAQDAAIAAGNLQDSAAAALAAAGPDAAGRAYGVALMDGVLKGLEDRRSTVEAKAAAIANAVKNQIRDAWDIHSPSREGQYLSTMLMRGLEIPIRRDMPNIIGMLDALELKTERARAAAAVPGNVVNNNQRSGSVSVNIEKVEASTDMDVRRFGEELAAYGNRVVQGMGG